MTISRDHSHTLSTLLEEAVRWKGGDVLFEDEAEQLAAPEVGDLVARFAGGLASLGIGKGDRVAFVVGSSARHAVAFFACARIGAIPCALHTRETAATLAGTVRWLGARALVTDADRQDLANEVGEHLGRVLLISLGDTLDERGWQSFENVVSLEQDVPPAPSIGADDPAYVILSSGTTGTPKGIVHTHRTAWAAALAGGAVYGDIGRDDRLVIPMTPSFAAWVNLVLPFLAARSTLVFQGRFEPAAYLDVLGRRRVTYAALPPTLWRLALRGVTTPVDLPELRYVFFSGEPGSPDLIDALGAAFPQASVREAWLSSEGGCGAGVVAGHEILVDRGKATAAGLPVPGASLRIGRIGSATEAADSGETGEILVSASSVAARYWGDDSLSAARFADGWWRTGDVGHIDPDGVVFITGRTDNVINTGGVKVHAEEVEAVLLLHPDVHLVAVVGVPDPTWGTAIEAHVVAAHAGVTEDAILDHCRSLPSLPAFKVPKRIIFHDALPTTATGKIYRRALRSPAP